ncbi:unnamed protein product [Caenorhabditis auriculariae]|uniref:Uncharacterized protein n=1 Tax=Caenorhabditis auriculariae TaxID=2777116 RepID=A0A8S1GU98_9PELO|nr:unnamed protein product [Caenorhabditis auriculariae]
MSSEGGNMGEISVLVYCLGYDDDCYLSVNFRDVTTIYVPDRGALSLAERCLWAGTYESSDRLFETFHGFANNACSLQFISSGRGFLSQYRLVSQTF